jgi:hypothetical protein
MPARRPEPRVVPEQTGLSEVAGRLRSREGRSVSISSMTNVAFARRKDTEPVDSGPATLPEVAARVGEAPATASSASSTLSAIATYIPTEIVTLYVSVLAVIGVSVPTSSLPASTTSATADAATRAIQALVATPLPAFAFFVVLTPIVVWALYATKVITAGKPLPRSVSAWPKWEMFASTLAFIVWAAALPSSPLEQFGWFNAGLAGISVLVVSSLLGIFSPIFTRTTLANS